MSLPMLKLGKGGDMSKVDKAYCGRTYLVFVSVSSSTNQWRNSTVFSFFAYIIVCTLQNALGEKRRPFIFLLVPVQ